MSVIDYYDLPPITERPRMHFGASLLRQRRLAWLQRSAKKKQKQYQDRQLYFGMLVRKDQYVRSIAIHKAGRQTD